MRYASPSQLRNRHPELYKSIVKRFDAYKKAQIISQTQSRLEEVEEVALRLHLQGLYPSFSKEAAGLSMPSVMSRKDMRSRLREVQRELGYRE